MKAIVQDRYGSSDVLKLGEIDKPAPADNEVLLRVHAASINQADSYFMTGIPYIMRIAGGGMGFGFRGPKIAVRGRDVAGRVEAVGKRVARFHPGDEVYGEVDSGTFAEYTCAPESLLALKPASLTFEQAAAVPLAANTALQGLRDSGNVQQDQKVVIVGASGGVGTFAVQIAKAFGADVTGVCSTKNVEMVKSLGGDQVIDYTLEDFTQGKQKYDLIFQVAGTGSPGKYRRALTKNGTLVLSSGHGSRWFGPLSRIFKALVTSMFITHSLCVLSATQNQKNLDELRELIEAGKIIPVIDSIYPLSEAAEAMRYFAEGHARAKVVIAVEAEYH